MIDRYEREERASMVLVDELRREVSVEAAREWVERLGGERLSLGDCSRGVVHANVKALIAEIDRLYRVNDGLSAIVTGRREKLIGEMACLKKTNRALRDENRNLGRYRTDVTGHLLDTSVVA